MGQKRSNLVRASDPYVNPSRETIRGAGSPGARGEQGLVVELCLVSDVHVRQGRRHQVGVAGIN